MRLLSDVDAFRNDNVCSRCGQAAPTQEEYEAEIAGSRRKLIELLSRKADAREAAGLGPVPRDEVDEMVEKLAQERLVALRAEHGIPAA